MFQSIWIKHRTKNQKQSIDLRKPSLHNLFFWYLLLPVMSNFVWPYRNRIRRLLNSLVRNSRNLISAIVDCSTVLKFWSWRKGILEYFPILVFQWSILEEISTDSFYILFFRLQCFTLQLTEPPENKIACDYL